MAGTGLSQIGQIAQPVRDLERAVRFYRDALGIKFLFQAPPGLAFFDCGGVRLMLSTPESGDFEPSTSVLYFNVDDVPRAHEQLSQRGVAFEHPPHIVHRAETCDLWMAFFRDPDGNLIAVMNEAPKS